MCALDNNLLDELDETIVRIGRIMSSRHVGPDCCPHTLSASQALLTRVLQAHGPAKVGEIAALLGVKPPAASAMIDSLEREGYVEREHDADDRRVTIVRLTSAGEDALEAAEVKRREVMRRYLSVLDEDDVRDLVRIHRVLLAAMDEGRI